MSPLEKVPFATFYPRWKYLCGTYFSKKKTFSSGLIYMAFDYLNHHSVRDLWINGAH